MIKHFRTFIPASAVFARVLALFALVVPHTWAAAQPPADPPSGPEAVLSFQATGQALVFRVETGGCTIVEDFHVDVQRSGREVSVSLDRQRPDHCKGWFPEGTEIAISYDDLGLQAADRIRLVNAITSP